MSVLVVGLSHNSAPVSLLERVAGTDDDSVAKLVGAASGAAHVTEATVISTCNRLEIYADVDRFHGSVEELSTLLVERAGESTEAMLPHLYVHYDDGAVSHLFQVAAGLDSMAVGEGQILGQTREALRLGQELGTVGPALNSLFQQALRVGKRSRAETDIDRAAPSLIASALRRASSTLGDVAGRRVAVLGAGSMAGLATATLARHGATVILLGRTPEKLEKVYDEIKAAGGPEPALAPVNLAVARPEDFQELAGLFDKEFGRLDGILHNASVLGDITPLERYGVGTWDSVMQVNVNSAFYLTQAMLPLLRASDDARLLFTSSSVGRKGRAFWGAYAVSKAATENLAQVFAEELENTSNIRVNTVNPGGTRTDMRAQAYPGEDPQTLKTPDEIMAPYLFLLGPDSRDVNGESIDAQPK